jgi:hypothetical protein
MKGVRHNQYRGCRRIALLALVLSLLVAACGGGGNSPHQAGGGVVPGPQLCSEAFVPLARTATVRPAADPSASPTPVPLSSCPRDSNQNVIVGPGACGPLVKVDKSFTTAAGNALGTITVNSGGGLAFGTDTSVTVETAGIVDNGTVAIGTLACPVGSQAPDTPNQNEFLNTHVVIEFTGAQPAVCASSGASNPLCHQKGIMVAAGGSLILAGQKGLVTDKVTQRTSWTYLSAPAGPPDTFGSAQGVKAPVPAGGGNAVQVAGPVDWQDGDWIAIATTDFIADSSEFVQISGTPLFNKSTDTTTINLLQPLLNYHFGGLAPDAGTTASGCTDAAGNTIAPGMPAAFCDGPSQNWGVDERAEVGLISRNVKLTSDAALLPGWAASTPFATGAQINAASGGSTYIFTATTAGTSAGSPPAFPAGVGQTVADGSVVWTNAGLYDPHWGGEINVEPGANVVIEGVEIEKFGKDQQGSYPINIIGTPSNAFTGPQIITANSIHHSYNHGIALTAADGKSNGASGLTVASNVVARAVGHLFYMADGSEVNNTFNRNLGLGAMLTGFTPTANASMFWNGDNLTNNPAATWYNGYDGLNIPQTDPINNTTAASGLSSAPPCGFWITNIVTPLSGNSIGGCQGGGTGIQYIPYTPSQSQSGPIGAFINNRAHGCYVGLDNTAGPAGGLTGDNLIPLNCNTAPNGMQCVGGNGHDVLTTFVGLTATRNRQLGAWLRPGFIAIENSRFAENREGLSLVSSGGTEGSPPGEWAILTDSILIGESNNNPGRFGNCPAVIPPPAQGCIGDGAENGYPSPGWPFFGYMFYDGPARLEDNKFVNFSRDITPYLDTTDSTFLTEFSANIANQVPGGNISSVSTGVNQPFQYEGDAALGWMQSNANSYPPTQYDETMLYENVDFRHRVYTEEMNQGAFVDGDKGTVILDNDATLSGYSVVDANGNPIAGKAPYSLNNLPFMGVADETGSGQAQPWDSVDECLAEGLQDKLFEQRPTALISPADYATLELTVLTPGDGKYQTDGITPQPCSGVEASGAPNTKGDPTAPNCNQVTIEKDQLDFPGQSLNQFDVAYLATAPNTASTATRVPCIPGHSCLSLAGRNQQGVYEPKVINDLGYTIAPQNGLPTTSSTLEKFLDVGFLDAPVRVRMVSDAAINTGSTTLTSATASFTGADVSDLVTIKGAGPSGATLSTTITGVTDKGTATVAAIASMTVSAASAVITRPFQVRLGFCYKTASGTAPPDASHFTVKTGVKSYGAPPGALPYQYTDPATDMLVTLFQLGNICMNLDFTNGSMNPTTCPSVFNGISYSTQTAVLTGIDASGPGTGAGQVPPTQLMNPNGYYYDAAAGMLFLLVQQTEPNAIGPSPLGNCQDTSTDDPTCPDVAAGESFYSCPADGCVLYTVAVDDTYAPKGAAACTPYGASGNSGYTQSYPNGMDRLVYSSGGAAVSLTVPAFSPIATTLGNETFAHISDTRESILCPINPDK